jgi:hypothetical protein
MLTYSELSAARKKELRATHHLYKRVSGEIVWALLEENGINTDYASVFLDDFLSEMHYLISVMDQLEKNTDAFFTFVAHEAVCASCNPFVGKIVSAGDADWRKCLPPFAVGCHITCQILSADEIQALSPEEKQSRLCRTRDLPLSGFSLLCSLVSQKSLS